jgi:hypothetical protein
MRVITIRLYKRLRVEIQIMNFNRAHRSKIMVKIERNPTVLLLRIIPVVDIAAGEVLPMVVLHVVQDNFYEASI